MPPPTGHLNHDGGSPPPPQKPNQKFLSLILKAIIMLILTSAFFLLLPLASVLLLLPLLLRHQYHRRHRHDSPSSGFSSKHLRKLPQFRFSKQTSNTYFEPDCVVCLEGFKQGQWCRKLDGCGHLFHRKCVDAWLVKITACPVCRRRVSMNEDKGIWDFGAKMAEFGIS
ncbi:hypothetical protein SLEP1_g32198 [Rubroshorea leprosula]|uniref:RING-type E3 ubiquitin transferase n=1 Tax=Rubroshorea leprosula TaxID=152421 RepID=A0AAV5KCI1_9ROSI|nr:hypothetical protein SLEP1_g32198 [Rubroshorea leprosula]